MDLQRVLTNIHSAAAQFEKLCEQYGVKLTDDLLNNYHAASTMPQKINFLEKTFGMPSFEAELLLVEANNNQPGTNMKQGNMISYLTNESIKSR